MKWYDTLQECEFNISEYPDIFGFVYEIKYSCGKSYIGKQELFNKVTLPKNKNRKKKEVFLREKTNWQEYNGSSKLSNGLTIVSKNVIAIANTRRALTYLEVKHLFRVDAIFNEEYLNLNAGGVYFQNVFDELKNPIRREFR